MKCFVAITHLKELKRNIKAEWLYNCQLKKQRFDLKVAHKLNLMYSQIFFFYLWNLFVYLQIHFIFGKYFLEIQILCFVFVEGVVFTD